MCALNPNESRFVELYENGMKKLVHLDNLLPFVYEIEECIMNKTKMSCIHEETDISLLHV